MVHGGGQFLFPMKSPGVSTSGGLDIYRIMYIGAAGAAEGLDHLAGSPPGDALPCHILDSMNASIELTKKKKRQLSTCGQKGSVWPCTSLPTCRTSGGWSSYSNGHRTDLRNMQNVFRALRCFKASLLPQSSHFTYKAFNSLASTFFFFFLGGGVYTPNQPKAMLKT